MTKRPVQPGRFLLLANAAYQLVNSLEMVWSMSRSLFLLHENVSLVTAKSLQVKIATSMKRNFYPCMNFLKSLTYGTIRFVNRNI